MENNEGIDTKFRKMMPEGVSDVSNIRDDITPIYDEEKLDLDAIKTNPILKPIAETNNSFINFELVINKALLEYQEDKSKIDAMIIENPRYSETMILSKVQSMLIHVKTIIHSQDIQKEDMKKTIKEMVKIAKSEYGLLEEQSKEEVPKAKEETAETGEETTEEKKEAPPKETVYSELIEKEIPIPKDKSNKKGFVPI